MASENNLQVAQLLRAYRIYACTRSVSYCNANSRDKRPPYKNAQWDTQWHVHEACQIAN